VIWRGLAPPNGSPYRAAFVCCGMLTMVAWLSLARRPHAGALLAGAGVILATLVLTRHATSVRPSVWFTVLVGGPVMLAALLVLLRPGNDLRLGNGLRAGSGLRTSGGRVLR